MKRWWYVIPIFLFLCFPVSGKSFDVKIHLKKAFSAGSGKVLFAEVTAACGGNDGSVYILDRRAGTVYRYSEKGELLSRFGSKGRGPGEFAHPGSIACISNGRVVVCEDMTFASIFDSEGKFIRRLRVERGLELHYIADDLFYAWRWEPGVKQQILVNPAGKIRRTLFSIRRSDFSVNIPDESGRMVMTSFISPVYTPRFLFAGCGDFVAVAVSDRYEIHLLDGEGKTRRIVTRKLQPEIITQRERKKIEAEITLSPRLHEAAKKVFKKRIPKYRNFMRELLLSPGFLWVVRLRESHLQDPGPVLIDLFTLEGEFKGSFRLPGVPVWASRNRVLVREPGDEPMAGMYEYRLK